MDANFIDSMEFKLEFAEIVSGLALTINQFVANVHSQQREPLPWLYLGDASVSASTSMPQKRNPRDLGPTTNECQQRTGAGIRTAIEQSQRRCWNARLSIG